MCFVVFLFFGFFGGHNQLSQTACPSKADLIALQVRNPGGLGSFSAVGLTRLNKVPLAGFLCGGSGENLFPSSFKVSAELVPCSRKTEVPLPLRRERPSLALGVVFLVLAHATLHRRASNSLESPSHACKPSDFPLLPHSSLPPAQESSLLFRTQCLDWAHEDNPG